MDSGYDGHNSGEKERKVSKTDVNTEKLLLLHTWGRIFPIFKSAIITYMPSSRAQRQQNHDAHDDSPPTEQGVTMLGNIAQ